MKHYFYFSGVISSPLYSPSLLAFQTIGACADYVAGAEAVVRFWLDRILSRSDLEPASLNGEFTKPWGPAQASSWFLRRL